MHVLKYVNGSFLVRVAVDHNEYADWAPFTPLQPLLDDIRLLDCVPTRTRIPGVGTRWSSVKHKHNDGYGRGRYELED